MNYAQLTDTNDNNDISSELPSPFLRQDTSAPSPPPAHHHHHNNNTKGVNFASEVDVVVPLITEDSNSNHNPNYDDDDDDVTNTNGATSTKSKHHYNQQQDHLNSSLTSPPLPLVRTYSERSVAESSTSVHSLGKIPGAIRKKKSKYGDSNNDDSTSNYYKPRHLYTVAAQHEEENDRNHNSGSTSNATTTTTSPLAFFRNLSNKTKKSSLFQQKGDKKIDGAQLYGSTGSHPTNGNNSSLPNNNNNNSSSNLPLLLVSTRDRRQGSISSATNLTVADDEGEHHDNNGEDVDDAKSSNSSDQQERLRGSLQRMRKENSNEFKQNRKERSALLLRSTRYLLSNFILFRFLFLIVICLFTAIIIFFSDSHDPTITFTDAIFVSVSATSGTGLTTIDTGAFGQISRTTFHIAITFGSVSFFGNIVSIMRGYVAENEQEYLQLNTAGVGGMVLYFLSIFIGSLLLAIQNGWDGGFRAGDGAVGNCLFSAPKDLKEKGFSLFVVWLFTSLGICLFPVFLRMFLRLAGIICRFQCIRQKVPKKYRDALQDCLEAPSSHVHMFLFDASATKFVVFYFFCITMIQLIPLLISHNHLGFLVSLAQTSGTRFSGLQLFDFHDLNIGLLAVIYFVLYLPGVWVPRVNQKIKTKKQIVVNSATTPSSNTNNNNNAGNINNNNTNTISNNILRASAGQSQSHSTNNTDARNNNRYGSTESAPTLPSSSSLFPSNNNNNINASVAEQPEHASAALTMLNNMHHSSNNSTSDLRYRQPLNDQSNNNNNNQQERQASSFAAMMRNRQSSLRASTRVPVRERTAVYDQWYGQSFDTLDAMQSLGADVVDDEDEDEDVNNGDHQNSKSSSLFLLEEEDEDFAELLDDSLTEMESTNASLSLKRNSISGHLRHRRLLNRKVSVWKLIRKAILSLFLDEKFWLLAAVFTISVTEYSLDAYFPASLREIAFEVMGAFSTSGMTLYPFSNDHPGMNGKSLSARVSRFSQLVLILTMFCGSMRGFVFFRVPIPEIIDDDEEGSSNYYHQYSYNNSHNNNNNNDTTGGSNNNNNNIDDSHKNIKPQAEAAI